MISLKAVAFDFDGVLLESVNVKTQAFRKLFSRESPEHLQRIVAYHIENGGISRFDKFRTIYRDILGRPLDETEFKNLCDQFAALVVDEVVAAPWVAGAEEFLQRHKGTYQFFVVSATPDEEIKDIVRRRQIHAYFSAILGSPRKKSELLQELLTCYHLAPSEIVYVGDAMNDWEAARHVGIPFIWRRTSEDVPFLPGYTGPCLSSLQQLENALTTCSPDDLARRNR